MFSLYSSVEYRDPRRQVVQGVSRVSPPSPQKYARLLMGDCVRRFASCVYRRAFEQQTPITHHVVVVVALGTIGIRLWRQRCSVCGGVPHYIHATLGYVMCLI